MINFRYKLFVWYCSRVCRCCKWKIGKVKWKKKHFFYFGFRSASPLPLHTQTRRRHNITQVGPRGRANRVALQEPLDASGRSTREPFRKLFFPLPSSSQSSRRYCEWLECDSRPPRSRSRFENGSAGRILFVGTQITTIYLDKIKKKKSNTNDNYILKCYNMLKIYKFPVSIVKMYS